MDKELINTIILSFIIPVSGVLIVKYFSWRDSKSSKKQDEVAMQLKKDIDSLREDVSLIYNDVSLIKKELQISAEEEELLLKLEKIMNYYIGKFNNVFLKNVFIEKNQKFLETTAKILHNHFYNIDDFDQMISLYESSYMYCELYLKKNLSVEFSSSFLQECSITFSIFKKDLEYIIFNGKNQTKIQFIDCCISFVRQYLSIAFKLSNLCEKN